MREINTQNWEKEVRMKLSQPEFYGLICKYHANHDQRVLDKLWEEIKDSIIDLLSLKEQEVREDKKNN